METRLAQAERHVRENEARITRQRATIAELSRDSHPRAAATASRVLETMLETQRLALQHLELERIAAQTASRAGLAGAGDP